MFKDAVLEDSSSDTNIEYFWFASYKIAYSTSIVIDMISDDTDDAELRHIKGGKSHYESFGLYAPL